jgi:tail sheath protein
MAQFLSPGVFIQEQTVVPQIIGPVTTSNMGIVTWTPQGPANIATFVTSFPQFQQIFGGYDSRSFGAYAMAGFFQNGGRAAYVVRVTPSNAVNAQADIRGLHAFQQIETGTGAQTTFTETASTTTIAVNAGASPVAVGASAPLTIEYRAAGTAVTAQQARARDGNTALNTATAVVSYEGRVDPYATQTLGTGNSAVIFRSVAQGNTAITVAIVVSGVNTALSVTVVGNAITINSATNSGSTATTTATQAAAAIAGNTAASALVTAAAGGSGTGVIAAAGATNLIGIPAYDERLDAIIAGTFSITWNSNSVAKTITIAATTTPIVTGTDGAGSAITIDLRSGRFSLLIAASEAPVSADNGTAIATSYTPNSATITLTSDTTVNAQNNMGILGTQLTSGGTTTASLSNPPTGTQSYINVVTGAYNLSFQAGATNIPANTARVLATYKTVDWVVNTTSPGAWGNNLSIVVQGSPNYFTTATQQYTRFTTLVYLNGLLQETYSDLVYSSPTSTAFFANVINALSQFINVVQPGGNEAPPQLNGLQDTMVIAGGNDTDTSRSIQATLVGTPIAPRTLVITYTDSLGVARTIKDNGQGGLTGDIDPGYVSATANTVNYTSGFVDFKTVPVAGPLGIKGNTLVTAAYYSNPTSTQVTEIPGDATKGYTAGTDGTFNTTNFGRNQYTGPGLAASFQGLYALSKVDDIMQVVVPDFAGDVTVSGDLLSYAAARAALPQGGDRFIVLNVPQGSTAATAVDWFRNQLAQYSDYAALYWPWVKAANALQSGQSITIPVVGHVCGVYARTDYTRNVGKSPGGTVDGQLVGITSLETLTAQSDRDLVYPNKINPLISSPQTGMAVWGVRTISINAQWKYINARRLFMFLEKSIYNSTFWIIFENNGPALWARIKAQLNGFLVGLFNDGYFAGSTPDKAFFIIVDESNNTPLTIAQGQVNITVGCAVGTPAEFAVFVVTQVTAS